MAVTVNLERCDGNAECVKACAFAAIEVRDGKAVVFDNCTDCGACVLACGPKAIWSEFFSPSGKAGVLAVDFSPDSGIASVVESAARSNGTSTIWMTVDSSDAGAAADAIAAAVRDGRYLLTVLPHRGPGPAIAARTAQRLDANLLAGCTELRIDDGGGTRAVRTRYGGVAKASARCGSGVTVATVRTRSIKRVAAAAIGAEPIDKLPAGPPIDPPVTTVRRIVTIGPNLPPDTHRAARACAQALGAAVVDVESAVGKRLAPDLYVAFGVDGSTEHNAAFRNSSIVVAVVTNAGAPIAQIADFVLVGDVGEHAQALLAAL